MKELLILGAGTGSAVSANMLSRKQMGTVVDDITTRDPVCIGAEDTLQQA